MAVANQYLISIQKTPIIKGEKGGYLAIKTDEWIEASKILSPSAFQLFLYLADKQNGYKDWQLSREVVCGLFGFSAKTYNRAAKELVEKGYLKQQKGVRYLFFTMPLDKNVQ